MPLPGLRGTDPIGCTVPDLDEAVASLRTAGIRVLDEPTASTGVLLRHPARPSR